MLVCLLHAGALTPGLGDRPVLYDLFDRLGSGMQLFFVISGYLIARSWAGLAGRPDSLAVYAFKRAGKILPLYLVVLHLNIGLYLLLHWCMPDLPPVRNSIHGDNLTLPNYLAHLFFAQGFVPAWIHSLVDGSWSICVEVYFYLLFPLVLARLGRSLKVQILSVLLACVAAELTTYLLRKSAAGFSYYNFITQLPCLMMGALLYRAEAQATIVQRFDQYRWQILGTCCALCLLLWLVRFPGVHMVYAALFALAIGAARTIAPQHLKGPAFDLLERVGQFSYALFFSHLLLLKLQHMLLRAWWPDLPFAVFLTANLVTGVWLSAIIAERCLHPIDRGVVEAVRRRLALRSITRTDRIAGQS